MNQSISLLRTSNRSVAVVLQYEYLMWLIG